MFTFGSLFAGIGGMDLGLERAGMTCRWQVEIDPDCRRWLAYHWPDVRRYEDVKNCGEHNLEPVDLICGGFPCQPHSVAGKRKGAADDRNLWPEFIRIIREMRPRYVLAENVPGIVTTYLDQVLSDLESEAYACWTFNIPACAFDAPHLRKRIFIVAYTNKGCSKPTQEEIRPGRYAAELCSEDVAHAGGTRLERPARTGDPKQRRKNVQPPGSSQNVAHAPGQQEGSVPIRQGGSLKTETDTAGNGQDVPNSNGQRLQRQGVSGATGNRSQVMAHANSKQAIRTTVTREECNPWPTQPGLGVLADGLSPGLAGPWLPEPPVSRTITRVPGLNAKLRGLGNAVVPHKAQWVGERIMEVEANER